MLPPEVIILRLAVAAILGLCVGVDRSRLDEAAGLRTHALVASGACLFMIVSAFGFADVRGIPAVVLDPSRIAAQVVTGIGFLGAGTIIVQREIVKGLTTAASVWAVAAVGLAAGGGLYMAAICATVLILVILVLVRWIEPFVRSRSRSPINIVIDRQSTSLSAVRSAIEQAGVQLDRVVIQTGQSPHDSDRVELWLKYGRGQDYVTVSDALCKTPGVQSIDAAIRPIVAAEEKLTSPKAK